MSDIALREALWKGHGHTGLYGDDGEMQCGTCLIDFKRAPPVELVAALFARSRVAHFFVVIEWNCMYDNEEYESVVGVFRSVQEVEDFIATQPEVLENSSYSNSESRDVAQTGKERFHVEVFDGADGIKDLGVFMVLKSGKLEKSYRAALGHVPP